MKAWLVARARVLGASLMAVLKALLVANGFALARYYRTGSVPSDSELALFLAFAALFLAFYRRP